MDILPDVTNKDLLKYLDDTLKPPKILVVGDLMIDEYITGTIDKISPEAPVPIVDRTGISRTLGGAGNVVNNLVALGAEVSVCGVVGDDIDGVWVSDYLKDLNVLRHIYRIDGLTTLKQRVVVGSQHVLRLDNESSNDIDNETQGCICKFIEKNYANYDVIILSDYNKGVISSSVCGYIITIARGQIPILVDPKGTEYIHYKYANILTPNEKEANVLLNSMVGSPVKSVDFIDSTTPSKCLDISSAGEWLFKTLNLNALLVTCGERGIRYIERNTDNENLSSAIIPAQARQVFDITGAGDTVISTLAFCIANNIPYYVSTVIANIAAGITVSKTGTSTVNLTEIRHEIKHNM